MPKVLVSPVAFNEKLKLRSVIERFIGSSAYGVYDYVVVDDGSTDGTVELLAEYSSRGVRTLRHDCQKGVGAAIRTAIGYARENGYEFLVIMAGNDKDNPEEIPALLAPAVNDGYDFVQGSRYKGANGVGGDMPLYRKIATRLHPWLMSFFTGVHVTDSTNGFRAIRLKMLDDQGFDINQDWLDHYELEPYLMFKCIRLGYRFREVFVTKVYPSRKLGYTKMRPIFGWWSILRPLFLLGLGIKK